MIQEGNANDVETVHVCIGNGIYIPSLTKTDYSGTYLGEKRTIIQAKSQWQRLDWFILTLDALPAANHMNKEAHRNYHLCFLNN